MEKLPGVVPLPPPPPPPPFELPPPPHPVCISRASINAVPPRPRRKLRLQLAGIGSVPTKTKPNTPNMLAKTARLFNSRLGLASPAVLAVVVTFTVAVALALFLELPGCSIHGLTGVIEYRGFCPVDGLARYKRP